MADEDFGFLTEKVGPLPVWGWGLAIVGIYYWYTHYGPGASTSSTTTATVSQSLPSSPQYGGSQYKTNAEWEAAAINYLVGESVPPDQASSAVWNYLHSKDLSTQEQKDVNLAIEGIGPPHSIPQPATVQAPTAKKAPVKKTHTVAHHKARNAKAHHKTHNRKTYTVKRGNTLSGIARTHHVSLKTIEKDNPGIKNPNLIHPGEKIRY